MKKGSLLTDFEKGQISAYLLEGKSLRWIANKIHRSRTAISTYLRLGDAYGKTPVSGWPCSIGNRTRKSLIKFATGKIITANQLKSKFDLKVSKNTILSVLKTDGGLQRRRIKRKPILNENHKALRLEFTKLNMTLGEKMKYVIFSDEKKFNLDRLDGYLYY